MASPVLSLLLALSSRHRPPPGEGGGKEAMASEEAAASAPPCDFCAGMPAVVYCRADSARLCLPCDRHVHGANTVSTRHARAPLCAACFAAPAAFRRRSRASGGGFLCGNCDFEKRDRDAAPPGSEPPLHDRAAVEEYTGCPSIGDLAVILGVGGVCEKAAGDGWWLTAWEQPQVLRLEDVIVPTTSCHGLQPLVTTPSSPKVKDRGAGGKLNEEVIRQLRGLANSEAAEVEPAGGELVPSWDCTIIGHDGFEGLNPEAATMAVPTCEHEAWIAADSNDDPTDACRTVEAHKPAPASSSAEPCLSSFVEIAQICPSLSNTSSNNVEVDDHNSVRKRDPATMTPQDVPAKKGGYNVVYPDRGTVISRYKEKRKNRRFGKQIRYESRKARADGRLRIKGRFAKADEI